MTPRAKKLAELLTEYEWDAPHVASPGLDPGPEESQDYHGATYAELEQWAAMPHHGDCVKLPRTCLRCLADAVLHKAQWLDDRLEGAP